jgi:NAD(P)-dependent dehydrogenase (short-subunit alcohol dehydrogenase family)
MSKVWFVTGANSGFGASIAKAALAAGNQVVATARNMDKLRSAFPDSRDDNLALPGRGGSGRSGRPVRPHRCPREQRGQ